MTNIEYVFYYTGALVWVPLMVLSAFLVVCYVLSLVQISYRFARCPHKIFKDGITWHSRLVWLFTILPRHAIQAEDWICFGPRHDLYFIYGEKSYQEHERLTLERYERENEEHE